ncbi:MAG: DUF1513 domain-containing protein [Pararhodobacter sp.]
MPSRRSFLAGLAAATALPAPGWAEAGDPAYLAAARDAAGRYRLCGLDAAGGVVFDLALPERGHAAAAHPVRAEAIAFARRPGRFAVVVDCARGHEVARFDAPANRHFYGHGAFSADGAVLFTTENDLETLEGRIGMWDAMAGYRRIGEMPSGGTGPHDVLRLPGTDVLVVANGGLATHPDSGRAVLNLPTMRSTLVYLDPARGVLDVVELDPALRLNSIRHLAVAPGGTVAAAMQWQGPEGETPPLLFTHRRGAVPRLMAAPGPAQREMRNYAGSVALSGDGAEVAITSPRGGRLHRFGLAGGDFLGQATLGDLCGLAPGRGGGFLVSTGQGVMGTLDAGGPTLHETPGLQWDNHIVALGNPGPDG